MICNSILGNIILNVLSGSVFDNNMKVGWKFDMKLNVREGKLYFGSKLVGDSESAPGFS